MIINIPKYIAPFPAGMNTEPRAMAFMVNRPRKTRARYTISMLTRTIFPAESLAGLPFFGLLTNAENKERSLMERRVLIIFSTAFELEEYGLKRLLAQNVLHPALNDQLTVLDNGNLVTELLCYV